MSNGDCLRSTIYKGVFRISRVLLLQWAGRRTGETHIVAAEVVDRSLGEHSVVYQSHKKCQIIFKTIYGGTDSYIQAQTCEEEGSCQQSGSVGLALDQELLCTCCRKGIHWTHQLGLARSQGLESGLLAHGDLSTLHDQSQTAGDGITGFLSL